MGKAAKEHRKKVAKRNAKIKQQKSGMQKAFDMLLQQQIENMKNEKMKNLILLNELSFNFDKSDRQQIYHVLHLIQRLN